MNDDRLDSDLRRIYQWFPFLWKDYQFRVTYITRSYGMYHRGFILGIENDTCKIVFEKESDSQVEPIRTYIGTKSSDFKPPDYSHTAKYGWRSVTGLIYWVSGVQCERYKDVDQDLAGVSQYLKLNIDTLLDLFKSPDEFDSKIQYYRNLYKDQQISVEKL